MQKGNSLGDLFNFNAGIFLSQRRSRKLPLTGIDTRHKILQCCHFYVPDYLDMLSA